VDRKQILREIISDKKICEQHKIKDVQTLTTTPQYYNKIVEVMSVIINENDNNLSETQIYRKIKNLHNLA